MYSQSITRTHRTAFVLLIDTSGSMAEEMRFRGRTSTKAEAVAMITNELLFELLARANRTEGLRNYYDIAVLGYGGNDEVCSLLDEEHEMISIKQLGELPVELHREVIELCQPDGSVSLREIRTPRWVAPRAAGQTPMLDALRVARDLLQEWTMQPENAQSFPPILFNITDGEATDGFQEDIQAVSEQIRSLKTEDGNVLLINIHIAPDSDERTLFFPCREEQLHPNRYASLLYTCSSEMPACFDEAIRQIKGAGAVPPFRGVSFNASAAEVVAMLNIGTISVKTE